MEFYHEEEIWDVGVIVKGNDYQPYIRSREKERIIPLLMTLDEVHKFDTLLQKLAIKQKASFDLFIQIVSGCAMYAMKR